MNPNTLNHRRQKIFEQSEKSKSISTPVSAHHNGMFGRLFENLENEQLLTAEELAERLNIAVKTVRKWRYESVLPPDSMVKLRHQVRYRWGNVLRWLQTKEV